MPSVHGSEVLDHSAGFVWSVLRQPERYQQLLPAVIQKSEVVEQGQGYTILALTVGKRLINVSYTCRIDWLEPMRAEVRLLDGPFKQMTAHADIAPHSNNQCIAGYRLDCELSPGWLEMAAQKIFDSQLPKAIVRVKEMLAKEAAA